MMYLNNYLLFNLIELITHQRPKSVPLHKVSSPKQSSPHLSIQHRLMVTDPQHPALGKSTAATLCYENVKASPFAGLQIIIYHVRFWHNPLTLHNGS